MVLDIIKKLQIMNYILYRITDDKREEIDDVKGLEWEDAVSKFFLSFSFSTPEFLECGDKIELYNTADKVSVFVGVITTRSQSEPKEYEYSGYDNGFYLCKNELTTQYNNNVFEYILKDVCKKCNLTVGEYPDINSAKYTHIYRKATAEDILKDVYENAVKSGIPDNYFFDCKNGKINLLPFRESDNFRGVVSLIGHIDSFEYIKDFNITNSIDDLKNHVEVFTDNSVNKKNTDKPDGLAEDEASISRYGLLRHTEDMDKDSKQRPQIVAETVLKRLNKETDTISMSVLGDYRLQKGIITSVSADKIGLEGQYRILSSRHKINAMSEEVYLKVEKK